MNPPDVERIQKFKNQAAHFWELAEKTKANAPRVPPEWQREFNALTQRADSIRTKIEGTTAAVDTAYKHATNLYGVDNVAVNNLGLLPLIPWAVISASGAAISYFANDAITFNEKIDELERLEDMGYTREEAVEVLNTPTTAQKAAGLLDNKVVRYGGLALIGFGVYKLAKRYF